MDDIREKMTERVRAIIIDSGKILLINRLKKDESYWVFPGGAMEERENYESAVKRECLEELGVEVDVGRAFFKAPSTKLEVKGNMEHFYLCEIVGGKIGKGEGPEYEENGPYSGEYIIKWVNLDTIRDIDLRPSRVRDMVYEQYAK